ncbi:unnamed protein product [Caenorhabditis auriculariae]|uniref:Uncharacterized protein n=1 Tax=Caenorhabditis auriculariae TaxID=2777116 RepID=A0A8S1GVJ0_9PELO|nr:unnamed protein product [Caenorhabditis auriculariae]
MFFALSGQMLRDTVSAKGPTSDADGQRLEVLARLLKTTTPDATDDRSQFVASVNRHICSAHTDDISTGRRWRVFGAKPVVAHGALREDR